MHHTDYKKEREKLGELDQVAYMLGISEKDLTKREEGGASYPINSEAEFAMRHLSQNEKISARLLLGFLVRDIVNSEEFEECSPSKDVIIKKLENVIEYQGRIQKNMSLLEIYEVISIVANVEEKVKSREIERCSNEA